MDLPVLDDSLEHIHVLHLDDDKQFLDLTQSFIEDGFPTFDVSTETDAEAALDRLEAADIDAIVCDYDMPGMTGLQFLDRVREECPEVPFILFTGKGSEEIASEAISQGVTDYIQKKTDTDQYTVLANRIENAVGQYRAEQEIERRSEWYSRILEHSSDYVLIVNDMGKIRYVSPSITRMMGYDPEEIIGEDAFTFVLEDDMEEAATALGEIISEPGREVTVEFRARGADGSIQWLEVRGRNFLEDALIQGVMVNVRDITERKQRETELTRRQSFLEHSSDIITVLDEDCTIDYVSPAVEQVLGYCTDELTGEHALEFIHPDQREAVKETFERLVEVEGRQERAEFQFRSAEDEWCWIEARGSNYLTDPVISGVVINARDVTERKHREREIERQNQRLDEFTNVVSHDLKSPLSVATGNLELAQRQFDSQHVDRALNALARMGELLDNLRTLAKEGKTVGDTEPVDIERVVEDCWAVVDAPEAELVVDAKRTILADRSRVKQCLENLLQNAVDHGADDVTVTVGELDDGLFIEDDGAGIPDGRREDVFEVGYTNTDDGTGFGLSIVNRIVEAHGWEIRVTESASGGARFEITNINFANNRVTPS